MQVWWRRRWLEARWRKILPLENNLLVLSALIVQRRYKEVSRNSPRLGRQTISLWSDFSPGLQHTVTHTHMHGKATPCLLRSTRHCGAAWKCNNHTDCQRADLNFRNRPQLKEHLCLAQGHWGGTENHRCVSGCCFIRGLFIQAEIKTYLWGRQKWTFGNFWS